jgi:hypothetical protein
LTAFTLIVQVIVLAVVSTVIVPLTITVMLPIVDV